MTGSKNIARTLKSIASQTYPNIETLIVDSFSMDSTQKVCQEYPVRLFRVRGNRSRARNHGIAQVNGDYVLFADSDHVLTQRVVEECVTQALRLNADCIMVPVTFIGDKRSFLDCSRMRNAEYEMGIGIQTHILFYSSALLQAARYPEETELFEDAIFYSEACKNRPKLSRVESVIYHVEDPSVTNLIIRSWNYGSKFRETVSAVGWRKCTRILIGLSAVDMGKMVRFTRSVLPASDDPVILLQFPLYVLLKHLSFALACCLSLLRAVLRPSRAIAQSEKGLLGEEQGPSQSGFV